MTLSTVSQHPLQSRLQSLRSRVLRLQVVRGLSAVVASVLALVIVLASIDYALRFRDRGVLVIFAACVLCVFVWTLYRLLRRLRRIRLGDAELALQVEARFPQVKDRLASAVEFLSQAENDATAGSAVMRRVAIAQAAAQCDGIDFAGVLNLRPALCAALASLAVCLVAAVLVVLNPSAARTAIARLSLPLGREVWPQETHLQLKNPVERVARGQPLEIEVVDARGVLAFGLPRLLSSPRRPRQTQRGERADASAAAIDDRAAGTFDSPAGVPRRRRRRSRDAVDGGRCPRSTGRRRVKRRGLSSPLHQLARRNARRDIHFAPLGRLAHRAVGRGQQAVAFRGAPLRRRPQHSRPLGRRRPQVPHRRTVARTARRAHVGKTSAYTITMVDGDGIRGGEESWQFRVQADNAPSVAIERPASNLFLTPRARVDLRIDARDDLGLRRVDLVYSASGATTAGEAARALYEGPQQAAVRTDAGDEGTRGDRRTIDYRWDLEELKLRPDTQLTVYAAASDYCPQTGRSEPRTFSIITPEKLQEHLAARQGQICAELARLLQRQRAAPAARC